MSIASVSSTIKFHEFPQGDVIHQYRPGNSGGNVRGISWSNDGNWLAIIPHAGHIEIIGVKDHKTFPKLIKTIDEVTQPKAIRFPNTLKRYIAIGTRCGYALLYDMKSRNVKRSFNNVGDYAAGTISDIAFTADDAHCLIGCERNILIYDNVNSENNVPTKLILPNSANLTCMKTNVFSNNNFTVAGTKEGIVIVWDTSVNRKIFSVEAHGGTVNSLAFSPINSNLILTAGADRQFCLFDAIHNECVAKISVEHSATAVDFSPDGDYFVIACRDGLMHVFDSRITNQPVNSFQTHHDSAIKYVAFQNKDCTNSNKIKRVVWDSSTTFEYNSSGIKSPYNNQQVIKENNPVTSSGSSFSETFFAGLGVGRNAVSMKKNNSSLLKSMFKGYKNAVPSNLRIDTNTYIKSDNSSINTIKAVIAGCDKEELKRTIDELIREGSEKLVENIRNNLIFENERKVHQLRSIITEIHVFDLRRFYDLMERAHELSNSIRLIEVKIEKLQKLHDAKLKLSF